MSHTSSYFRDASALPKLGPAEVDQSPRAPSAESSAAVSRGSRSPRHQQRAIEGHRPGPPRRRASAASALRQILDVEKFSERSLRSNRRLHARGLPATDRLSRWWLEPGPGHHPAPFFAAIGGPAVRRILTVINLLTERGKRSPPAGILSHRFAAYVSWRGIRPNAHSNASSNRRFECKERSENFST